MLCCSFSGVVVRTKRLFSADLRISIPIQCVSDNITKVYVLFIDFATLLQADNAFHKQSMMIHDPLMIMINDFKCDL